MIRTLTPRMGLTPVQFWAFLSDFAAKGAPDWVGDRPFLIVEGTKVRAAFYVKEKAFAFAYLRGYALVEAS